MAERPILFSGAMVRAILAGKKTQTRRVCKGARELSGAHDWPIDSCPYGRAGDRLWVRETWRSVKKLDAKSPTQIAEMAREAGCEPWGPVEYVVDQSRVNWEPFMPDEPGKTRVSLHMPRWASRITLEVTGVRVERLQDITPEAVVSEGLSFPRCGCEVCRMSSAMCTADAGVHLEEFAALWDAINGKRPDCLWSANPWVWVVSFKRLEKS